MKKDKEIEEFFNSYKARVVAMDDTPNMICGSLGKFKMLPIEEYDELQSKIANLEAKLAESEKARKEAYQEGFLQKQFDKDMEIMQLKQQLAEKENTITNLIEDTNASKEFYKKQFNEQVWLCEELREKLAEKDQDKISFCIEQLNLLYKTLTTEDVWKTMKKGWWLNNGECLQLRQTIDNQIKQLKGVENE